MPSVDCPSVTNDGYVSVNNVNGDTWAELMARTSGTSFDSASSTFIVGLESDGNANEFDAAYKCFPYFDLSGIPAGATIDAADLLLRPTNILDEFGEAALLSLLEKTPAGGLNVGAWDDHGAQRLAADKAVSALSVGSLQTVFTLNAAGLALVEANIGGSVQFCVLLSWLLDNTSPTWPADGIDARVIFSSQNDGLPARRPLLRATYSVDQTAELPVLALGFDQPQLEPLFTDGVVAELPALALELTLPELTGALGAVQSALPALALQLGLPALTASLGALSAELPAITLSLAQPQLTGLQAQTAQLPALSIELTQPELTALLGPLAVEIAPLPVVLELPQMGVTTGPVSAEMPALELVLTLPLMSGGHAAPVLGRVLAVYDRAVYMADCDRPFYVAVYDRPDYEAEA